MFQPIPRPNRRSAVDATLEIHESASAETPMTRSPDASALMRPTRSTSTPTTSTSAYMPRTCAPMIGKTSLCVWWCFSTTTYPVRFMIETITPKLANAVSIAGMTPGRRTISPSGAAGPVVAVSAGADQLRDLLRVRADERHDGGRDEADPG